VGHCVSFDFFKAVLSDSSTIVEVLAVRLDEMGAPLSTDPAKSQATIFGATVSAISASFHDYTLHVWAFIRKSW